MADRKEIKEALSKILSAISASPKLLTDKVKNALGLLLEKVRGVISTPLLIDEEETVTSAPIFEEQVIEELPEVLPPRLLSEDQQETISMLWQVSGGNPEVFLQYLNGFPDDELRQFSSTPEGIDQITTFLEAGTPPIIPPGSSGGIPESEIGSSNVYGTDYNPQTGSLKVKFNGKKVKSDGPSYQYEGVPPEIASMVQNGDIPARTDGSNQWGTWWQGKKPSLGASANSILKNGPFPYQKIAG